MMISYWEILIRMAVATVVGIIFGQERQRKQKPVGIRTYVIVSVTACVVALMSAYSFNAIATTYGVPADPARLVVGMLTGIGFLGAGIIWRSTSGSVQGITTAATILFIAVLGIACGMGEYFIIAVATIIGYCALIAERVTIAVRKKIRKRKGLDVDEEIAPAETPHPPQYTANKPPPYRRPADSSPQPETGAFSNEEDEEEQN